MYLRSIVEDVGWDGEGTDHKALDAGWEMVNMVVMMVVVGGRLGCSGFGCGVGHRGRTLNHMNHFAVNICNDTGIHKKRKCLNGTHSKDFLLA